MRKLIKASTRRTQAKKLQPDLNLKTAVEVFKEADKEWKAAKEECKEAKKNRKELREDHILECAKKNVEINGNVLLGNEIKRLKTIEEQRAKAARLKRVLKPFDGKGVTTIKIPALIGYPLQTRRTEGFNHYDIDVMWERILPNNGKDIKDWERITDKNMIHKMLLQWQRKHFTQAQETPLGNVEWTKKLRKECTQENIMLGIYDEEYQEIPQEAQELFEYMKRPAIIDEEITIESEYSECVSFIKLALDKCFYSLVKFLRQGLGHRHCLIHKAPGEMKLKE